MDDQTVRHCVYYAVAVAFLTLQVCNSQDVSCPYGSRFCSNSHTCVKNSTSCILAVTCEAWEISCPDGTCVEASSRCINTTTKPGCNEWEVTCSDGSCASLKSRCPCRYGPSGNGVKCNDGSCAFHYNDCPSVPFYNYVAAPFALLAVTIAIGCRCWKRRVYMNRMREQQRGVVISASTVQPTPGGVAPPPAPHSMAFAPPAYNTAGQYPRPAGSTIGSSNDATPKPYPVQGTMYPMDPGPQAVPNYPTSATATSAFPPPQSCAMSGTLPGGVSTISHNNVEQPPAYSAFPMGETGDAGFPPGPLEAAFVPGAPPPQTLPPPPSYDEVTKSSENTG